MRDVLSADSHLLPSRHVCATITEHGGMLLDLKERRGRWYALTPSAGLWWQRIQDGCTIDEASRAVAGRYRIDPAQATADLTPFLAALLRHRLLTPATRQNNAKWGWWR